MGDNDQRAIGGEFGVYRRQELLIELMKDALGMKHQRRQMIGVTGSSHPHVQA